MTCVFLFGPSCSGKSTLGKALQSNLGGKWTYIDRDELIERKLCTEAIADRLLDEKIQSLKDKVIVDAQIPWREKQKGEIYALLLPPLEVLLERDAMRTVKLQRTAKRAFYARQYVEETHLILNAMERNRFNCCFDSSHESVCNEIDRIKSIIGLNPIGHFS